LGVGVTKEAEIGYASLLGDEGRQHAKEKPFSDPGRGRYLQQMGMILDLLPPPPARILDLGCGTGWTTEFLHRSHYDVVGVDIASEMIELARQVPDRRAIEFVVGDYESLDGLGPFDAVIFFDALHHADDERAALQAAFRVLVPGGLVICSEPGRDHHITPESQRAIHEFGVNEKEMPPSHIIRLADEIGFRSGRALPYPFDILDLLDLITPHGTRPPAEPVGLNQRVRSYLRRSERLRRLVASMRLTKSFEASGRGGLTILEK
jgi:SAM-dependent methyltransferase